MQAARNKYVLFGLLAVLAIVLAITLRGGKKVKPAPTTTGYYSGPMRNKSDPTIYSTEEGQRVPTPPGASDSASWANVTVDKAGRVRDAD